MSPELKIDRANDVPFYRQIVEQIASAIRAGTTKPGDRLPTERELSAQLGIARGTITKAYDGLARSGIIEVTRGRGAFVSAQQDVLPVGRKEKAIEIIQAAVKELAGLRFSYREIESMVDMVLLEREELLESVCIAVVDCSPEALGILNRQLGILSRLNVKTFLLDELAATDASARLAEFELIVTTATHYSEVLGMAPLMRERMLRVVVSPSQETIISLAGLRPSQTIGVLSESRQFLAIIRQKLLDLSITNEVSDLTWPWQIEQLEDLLAERDVLIVPPVFPALLTRESAPLLTEFTQRGGRIIPFDYQIERGSLVYVEERIKELKEP